MKRIFTIVTVVLILAPAAAFAAGGQFTDDDDSIFESNIEWLAGAGVTAGCNPPTNDNFCPDDNVSRGQMAAFMQRFAQYLGAEDGTVSAADSAAHADHATNADDAALLDGLSAEDLIDSSPLVVAAADFHPDGFGTFTDYQFQWSSTGWTYTGDGSGCLQAPVSVPHGAVMTSTDIVVLDSTGSGTYRYLNAELGDPASYTPFNGSAEVSALTQTVAIDLTGLTSSDTAQNWIGVCLSTIDDVLYGARVHYTITDASIAGQPNELKASEPATAGSVNR